MMPKQRILTIEDDGAIRRGIVDALRFAGYEPLEAGHGEAGLQMAVGREFDLLLLDLVLPGRDGLEILREVRRLRPTLPVIILTARGEEQDRVRGLKLGADDYVVKPFSIKELLARVNAFLRRRRRSEREVYHFGDCQLDVASRRLTRNGQEVPLTPKEWSLLVYLVKRAGRALTRDQMLRSVWGHDILVTSRSIDRCITTLRGKIEPDPHRPTHIQTVREIGYRFEPGDE